MTLHLIIFAVVLAWLVTSLAIVNAQNKKNYEAYVKEYAHILEEENADLFNKIMALHD